jgi:hypothetical protein
LELARTDTQQQAIRVLEHASRIVNRVAADSTSDKTTGRLARELEGYVKRLKRISGQGQSKDFFKLLQNAQMKLVKLVVRMLR